MAERVPRADPGQTAEMPGTTEVRDAIVFPLPGPSLTQRDAGATDMCEGSNMNQDTELKFTNINACYKILLPFKQDCQNFRLFGDKART